MAAFVSDAFTYTGSTDLNTHGSWVKRSGTIFVKNTGDAATPRFTSSAHYYTTAAEPPSADYAVRADIGLYDGAYAMGLTARNQTAAADYYYARAVHNAIAAAHQIYRVIGGTLTLLAETGASLDPDGAKAAELRVVTNGSQVDIEWWWDGSLALSYSDTNASRILDAGYPGISTSGGTVHSNTWDNFEAEVIGGGVTIAANTGAAVAAGLGATVTTGTTISAGVGAAVAAGLTAGVAVPTLTIDGFAASGADLVITYTHTQVGTSPLLTASLERDGTPIADQTTSTLSGTLTVTNPGAGVYELTLLDLTDSNGTATDGPWGSTVTILGGDAGVEASVGEAVAAGLSGGIASPITISAGVGAATAAGLAADVAAGTTIAASTGAAVGAGLTAGVASPITVAAGTGAATGAGLDAIVTTDSCRITIPAGKVAADLTDFVVYVDLSHMTSAFWAGVKSDGGDVRVYAADGATAIPHDLVSFNYAGHAGKLFFKATLAAATDNTFLITFGDSGLSELAATDTYGRNACWSGYARAYVFEENVDRTGVGGAMTLANGAAVSGGVLELDGTNDYAYSDIASASTTWTMGAIVTSDTLTGKNRAFLNYGSTTDATTNLVNRATVSYRDSTTEFGIWNSTDGWVKDANPLSTGTVEHINGYHNGTSGRGVYRNGSLFVSIGSSTARPAGTPRFWLGASSSDVAEEVDGRYQIAYLRHEVLSADWIAAEYLSWRTPASFYTVEARIDAAVGAATAAGLSAGIASPITVAAGTGAASGAGLQAVVSSGTTIAAGTGAATASGLSAGVASPITVSAGVGQASAAGLQASVEAGGSTIAAGVGSAAAAGLTATVSSPQTISASTGAASAAGLAGNVASGITIPAGIGAASALGLTATVTAATHIVAGVGAASASGLTADVSSAPDAGRAPSMRTVSAAATNRSITAAAHSRRIH